jgi:hypothetical protein
MPVTITKPLIHDTVIANGAGNISVEIDNPDGDTCFAAIFKIGAGGMGLGDMVGSAPFTPILAGDRKYTATVNVGTISSADPTLGEDNRFFQLENRDEGTLCGHSFKARAGGSGEVIIFVLSKHLPSDQPVPAVLTLKLDSGVAKGTCTNIKELNKATQLGHSNDPKQSGTWISAAINLGAKGAKPAFWVLEKTDAKTWTLVLRQEKTTIVQYVCKTKVAKECKFPIKLNREGKGGKHFTKWPSTVTISLV